ncbi:Glycoprotein-N-acetylgalactosamine 3-beta-galactosyltransferase 1, variant 2 [Clonorchis sinensis]|uniref:Glycoprotein-N-acetylgalactosamine 3-beta-galactosyltransferase 1, variant 2 n=2 Tax=Clonorchis sinensis TaxID=79923 RepID=A0A8T1MNL3_CLOSI|nr:Glycoprotein-N-acetylgalactosamine 3-beta-galactosyltransferase 1, variant 2 [Clonorchis sinensis]
MGSILHDSLGNWSGNYLPLLLGMLAGCLLFSVRHGIGDERICLATNLPNNISSPSIGRKLRILCYINTFPRNYETQAIHAQNTWARRCDGFQFTSTVRHPKLSVLVINMTQSEIKRHLWVKMRKILRAIYRQADEYDYFFKADDDAYAVIPNLRRFLISHNDSLEPVMWGYRWMKLCPGGFFSGGPGYVLTRNALKRIVEQAIDRHPDCPTTDEDKEDVKMCLCGQAVGVKLKDAKWENRINLFYPFNLTLRTDRMARNKLKAILDRKQVSDSDLKAIKSRSTRTHENDPFDKRQTVT